MTITDSAALRASGMRAADRASLRMMTAWPRWLGRFWLETTVTYDASGEVIHTTVVRFLGLPLLRSTEHITLDADGRAFTMRGEQRMWPAIWARRTMSGHGTIDASARRAEYTLEFLGAAMRQSTVREDDLVTVTQQGPGFSGVQHLRRR